MMMMMRPDGDPVERTMDEPVNKMVSLFKCDEIGLERCATTAPTIDSGGNCAPSSFNTDSVCYGLVSW